MSTIEGMDANALFLDDIIDVVPEIATSARVLDVVADHRWNIFQSEAITRDQERPTGAIRTERAVLSEVRFFTQHGTYRRSGDDMTQEMLRFTINGPFQLGIVLNDESGAVNVAALEAAGMSPEEVEAIVRKRLNVKVLAGFDTTNANVSLDLNAHLAQVFNPEPDAVEALHEALLKAGYVSPAAGAPRDNFEEHWHLVPNTKAQLIPGESSGTRFANVVRERVAKGLRLDSFRVLMRGWDYEPEPDDNGMVREIFRDYLEMYRRSFVLQASLKAEKEAEGTDAWASERLPTRFNWALTGRNRGVRTIPDGDEKAEIYAVTALTPSLTIAGETFQVSSGGPSGTLTTTKESTEEPF